MRKIIFWSVLVLAFFLRFYKLGEVPFSLDWDENSNAYNAYSILKTGRDEYGTFLPITNRSFDDYKPPLYMYLNVPTVVFFGLTPFAARLPSAIFGFLTVPAIYFLAKKLFDANGSLTAIKKGSANLEFKNEASSPPRSGLRQRQSFDNIRGLSLSWLRHVFGWRQSYRYQTTQEKMSDVSGQLLNVKRETIALMAMFLFAISPWHLQFSRVGFEATVGLFFATAAITAFLYGLKDKKWLIPSSVFLGISAYSYHSERIFVPLLFIASFLIWRKEILKIPRKYLLAFGVVAVVVALPLVILIPPKVILQRFEVTTGRPRLEDIEKSIKFILQDQERGSKLGKYIHNRRFVIGQTWFGNYLSHFDFNFLFTKGDDNFRHHIENMGMVYFFQFPLLLYGVFLLIRNRNKTSAFLLAWLLIAPLPATPAVPNPHANRSLPMDPVLQIISAYAFIALFSQKFMLKKLILYSFSLWILLSIVIYLHNYWNHYPFDKADFWQYGYKEAVIESEKVKAQYEKINVDHSLEQAYVFWLFNTKYDPASYQQGGNRYHFDKYYFDAKPPQSKNELFISDSGNFPGGFEVIKIIYKPNGEEAVKIGSPR